MGVSALERLAKTGYYTSVISYVVFWVFELARPGFVSRYLSIHLFLLTAILFGALWVRARNR